MNIRICVKAICGDQRSTFNDRLKKTDFIGLFYGYSVVLYVMEKLMIKSDVLFFVLNIKVRAYNNRNRFVFVDG